MCSGSETHTTSRKNGILIRRGENNDRVRFNIPRAHRGQPRSFGYWADVWPGWQRDLTLPQNEDRSVAVLGQQRRSEMAFDEDDHLARFQAFDPLRHVALRP